MIDKINFENTEYEFCKNELLEMINSYMEMDDKVDIPHLSKFGYSTSNIEELKENITNETRKGKRDVKSYVKFKKLIKLLKIDFKDIAKNIKK